ncbi:hypothetical protein EDI_172020 [Entamoeba dispar SAW760]|uniref:Uncharacterized protein n=1 Tax=Entamoeba dispar (strain ATCC PRA-260 / SAW760) TaxID=370354 RepID=B0EGT8_ENTDS|nr:uncharacterized protein EDI_172020 [Entamoeba dispar SAW760]EDR26255.1 hypothetical protein EDI_172020 [Entamoeba dispar SAW760]|eukprot:EDR26255.1 hypothetical protein EDI_172020 [Entamoeba dispar SAW760]
MKRLDMVYLMKVVLHVMSMGDIKNIEMINKKCGIAINSLKINPWFTSKRDINQFCKTFNPTTCNCNSLDIDESVLMKVEKIRNYDLDSFIGSINGNATRSQLERNLEITEEEKEKLIKIIQKVESLICLSDVSDEIFEIIIQNMKKRIKIRCGETFAKMFDEIFEEMNINETMYPSEMIIHGDGDGRWIKNAKKRNIIFINENDNFIKKSNELKIPKGVKFYSPIVVLLESKKKINISYIRTSIIALFTNIQNSFESSDTFDIKIKFDDITDNEKRKKIYTIINKFYANYIMVIDSHQLLMTKNMPLISNEIPQLPECVETLQARISYSDIIVNQKYIENLDICSFNSSVELLTTNNLKALVLHGIAKLKINKRDNKQQIIKDEKEGQNENKNIFPNLEVLRLNDCSNLNIDLTLDKLLELKIVKCDNCKVNIKSDSIGSITLNGNTQSKCKFSLNKTNLIQVKNSEDFKLAVKSIIEQNIEILNSNQLKLKPKCPIHVLTIIHSKGVSVIGNERCNKMKLVKSTINKINIKPKRVVFKSIEECIGTPLKEAEEIFIVSMKDCVFEKLFDKCQMLCIDECENCQFIINKNEIKEMKITNCKNTDIKGELKIIKELVTIDNEGCNIPEAENVRTEDTEIIEIKEKSKNVYIYIDKKHIIIRNIHNGNNRIIITVDLNSDVTVENSENILFDGEYEYFGNLKLINQDIKREVPDYCLIKAGFTNSLTINHCNNMGFEIYGIKKSLEIIDSTVRINCTLDGYNFVTNTVHIENSKLFDYPACASSHKAIIDNSTGVDSIISHCKGELILRKLNDTVLTLNKDLKKIKMEECNGIDIENNVKGKDVKMVRCHDMEIVDTSNSIKTIECDNVEVITEENQGMEGFMPGNFKYVPGEFGGMFFF